MSNKKCSPEEFAAAIMGELQEYVNGITEAQKKAVDVVAKEVNETIKSHVTFKQPTGQYVKAFRVATTNDSPFGKHKTWYVKDPHYRMTHLLEKGHALPQGGRSRAFPHIQYGQEIAELRMMQLSEEAVKNAGR